jgi:uncharacterized repeat protein (TIGR03847 family)
MSQELEFDPADRITTAAIGEPGSRVFYLQASKGTFQQTWILEKEQVLALGRGSYELLSQIGQHEMTRELLGYGPLAAASPEFSQEMALRPDDPAFRIDPSSMAMRFDPDRNQIEITFTEQVPEGDEPIVVRVWVTPRQLASLAVQGMKIAAQGRPICPLCGFPMEPAGHHCPSSNGHSPRAQ